MMTLDQHMTQVDCAKLLGVHPRTVMRWQSQGMIRAASGKITVADVARAVWLYGRIRDMIRPEVKRRLLVLARQLND